MPLLAVLLAVLSGCGFFGGLSKPGGSRDSAPNVTLDKRKIIDATPKVEPRSRGGNFTPYTVLGKTYRVMKSSKGYKEKGGASWYGTKFHGRLTSNGERYNMYAMTAAH
ncbi:MAG: septal ring lytic transglycosylase RlpA, partial [Pseudomonadales bacterium]|nr:septal ring lytic transglycosylase RlpA [Pseudomonadales bacterium]